MKITQKMIDYAKSKECELYLNNVLCVGEIETNYTTSNKDILKVKLINSNYEFFQIQSKTDEFYNNTSSNKSSVSFYRINDPDVYVNNKDENGIDFEIYEPPLWFTVNDDLNIAEIDCRFIDESIEHVLRIHLKLKNKYKLKGVNDGFILENELMKKVITSNFKYVYGKGDVDHNKYIINLIELPFKIDNSYIVEKREIYLNSFYTGFVGLALNKDNIKIDLGVIKVKSLGNTLDFKNVKTILYLPCLEPIEINPTYVIGHEIKILYKFNIYNSLINVSIKSSINNEVIISKIIDLKLEIPFGGFKSEINNNANNIIVASNNNIKTAFIEVIKSDLNTDNKHQNLVEDFGVLNNLTGYVEVNEIDLKCNASNDEIEEILRVLRDGVSIKNTP